MIRISKPPINLREKLSELERPIGVKGNEIMRAETLQDARDLVSAGRKNILINGNFIVSQRGDYTSATAFSYGNTYYLDRWKIKGGSNPAGTIQDLTRKVKIAATEDSNSTGQLMVMQVIEDKTINLYGGKIVTLSALVKSNNPNCRVMYELSGSGGWMSANIDTNHNTHSGNGQEERLYVTFKLPDNYASVNTSNELRVYVGFDSYNSVGGVQINNGDYFEASEVQLEVGKVATEFEHRSYGEELALCQRYFFMLGDTNNTSLPHASYYNNTLIAMSVQFPVTMRANPSIYIVDGTGYFGIYTNNAFDAFDTFVIARPQPNCATLDCNGNGASGTAGHSGPGVIANSAARLGFNAEL